MPEIMTQLGIAGALLFVLFKLGEKMLKYFCNTISNKDEYIKQIVKDFNTTMNNHIDHETKAHDKETNTLDKLSEAIIRLCDLQNQPINIKKNYKNK